LRDAIKSTAAWQPLALPDRTSIRVGRWSFLFTLCLGNKICIAKKGYNRMSTSTYSLPELLRKWAQGDLTTEQAVGHILQHLLTLGDHQAEHEKRLRTLEQQLPAKSNRSIV
jgi:hypothetical protein